MIIRKCIPFVFAYTGLLLATDASAQTDDNSKFSLRLWFESHATDTNYVATSSRVPGEVAAMVFDPTDDRGVGVLPIISREEDGTVLLEFPQKNLKMFNNQLYMRLLMMADYHAPESRILILAKDALAEVREEGGILLNTRQLVRQKAKEGQVLTLVDQLRNAAHSLDSKLHEEIIKKLEELIAFELCKEEFESKPRGVIVPAYIYPSNQGAVAAGNPLAIANQNDWRALIGAASAASRANIPFWVVVNPDSGPGQQVNGDYTTALNALIQSGATVLGYVAAGQGDGTNRTYYDQQIVLDSVTKWHALYPQIQGIFLDTVPESETKFDSIRAVANHVRKTFPNCKIAINPGMLCDATYFELDEIADLICVNETNVGIVDWQIPDWLNEFPPSKICVIGWNIEEKDIAPAIANLRRRNAGFVYLTDRDDKIDLNRDSYPDPGLQWGRLPSPRFWQTFLRTVGQTVKPQNKSE